MLIMAIITVAGAAGIGICALLIHHRAAVLRREAGIRLEDEVREKNKQAKTLDVRVANDILGGADVDAALTDLQKTRASIHAAQSDAPWMWDVEDLTKWAKTELTARVVGINRKARLTTLIVLVVVALAVIAVNAVLYNRWSASPPVLSPNAPVNSTTTSSTTSVPSSTPAPMNSSPPPVNPAP